MDFDRFSTMGLVLFLGISLALALTVLTYIFILPEKKRGKLNKLGQFISDIFNFKFLVIEKVLQFFYILSTFICIALGVCMMFGIEVTTYYDTDVHWYGLYGILLVIVGPIVVRLAYEALMLGLLLVKNVIEINRKLKSQTDEGEYKMPSFKELMSKENFNFKKKTNANPNPYTNANPYQNTNSNAYPNSNPYQNTNANAYPNSNQYANNNVNQNNDFNF